MYLRIFYVIKAINCLNNLQSFVYWTNTQMWYSYNKKKLKINISYKMYVRVQFI